MQPWFASSEPKEGIAPPIRLLGFPFAGASSAAFYGLKQQLAGRFCVDGVDLPGRWGRMSEEPFVRMAPLVRALVSVLAASTDTRPYGLYGHSVGALIAFEVARAIGDAGLRPPLFLAVGGCIAPQEVVVKTPIHALPEADFVHQVHDRYGALPPQALASKRLLGALLPALRADIEIFETYRCAARAALDLPILALGGSDDAMLAPTALPAWGWQTHRIFRAATLAGGHLFLNTHAADVAGALQSFVAEIAPELAALAKGPLPAAGVR